MEIKDQSRFEFLSRSGLVVASRVLVELGCIIDVLFHFVAFRKVQILGFWGHFRFVQDDSECRSCLVSRVNMLRLEQWGIVAPQLWPE